MLQIIFVLAVAILLMIPTGKYLYHIATDQKTFADPVMDQKSGHFPSAYPAVYLTALPVPIVIQLLREIAHPPDFSEKRI